MSRIGDKPITIPEGVTVVITGNNVLVKGTKGELSYSLPQGIKIQIDQNTITTSRANNQRQQKAFHGLARSLLQNMITGVETGYEKKLELVGTGYRAKKQGGKLIISVGFSHPVEVEPLKGVSLDLEGETVIIVKGINKQIVGHMAAKIRDIRKPEPYKGKGIRYQGEIIRRKAGKAAKIGAAA